MARIGVVVLLTALEAGALLDVALMLRAGLNPIAFVLAAAVFAPWLVIEVRRISAVRATRVEAIASVTPLRPSTSSRSGRVHTAATNPTGKRMALPSSDGETADGSADTAAAA